MHQIRAKISDVTELFGFTARALRYYEERGLIEASRDRLNHRIYGSEARRRLEIIALLRGGSVPLRDVHKILEMGETKGRAAQLAMAVSSLEVRRGELDRQLKRIDVTLSALGTQRKPQPIDKTSPVCAQITARAREGPCSQFR